MNVSRSYLEKIHQLVSQIIPFNICYYYSIIPIGYCDNDSSFISVVMVNPTDILVCDTLNKILKPKRLKYKKLLISKYDYTRLIQLYQDYLFKKNQEEKIVNCLQNLDYKRFKILPKIDSKSDLNPKSYDLVLGGNLKEQKKINSLVLGGEEGIKLRFNSTNLAVRINSLHESLQYPNLAIKLLIKTLQKDTGIIVWVAYSLLRNINNLEINEKLKRYRKKLKKISLKGVNLQGLNLRNVNLKNANLTNANFCGTLINKNTKIDLKSLLIWKIINQGLDNQNLSEISFHESNLQGSQIKNTVFSNSLFSFTNLSRTILTNVNFKETTFNRVNLEQGNLKQINLESSLFSNINSQNSNWHQVNFKKSVLRDVNLKRSRLNNVDLSYANLTEVSFYKAHLINVNFKNANFNQVNFDQTILHNIDMSYLDLTKFDLSLSKLDLSNSKFVQTNLKGINLSGANLTGVNLSGANLRDANLENVQFEKIKLTLATYNKNTIFPRNFNPERFGAISC